MVLNPLKSSALGSLSPLSFGDDRLCWRFDADLVTRGLGGIGYCSTGIPGVIEGCFAGRPGVVGGCFTGLCWRFDADLVTWSPGVIGG